jgi:hypothetical protein
MNKCPFIFGKHLWVSWEGEIFLNFGAHLFASSQQYENVKSALSFLNE